MDWKDFENRTLERVQNFDPEARLAKGTGNVHEDGDVIGKEISVQCKFKSTEGLSLTKEDLLTFQQQARSIGKQGIMAVKCKTGSFLLIPENYAYELLSEVFNPEIEEE